MKRTAAVPILAVSALLLVTLTTSTGATTPREALTLLYKATDGPNWVNSTGWTTSAAPCSWHGVVCGAITGHVIGLNLANNTMRGAPPWRELAKGLPHILTVDVRNNTLYSLAGLDAMVTVEYFLGSLNPWDSAIPTQLAALSSLVEFDVAYSNVHGPIPPLGFLPLLNSLALSYNSLSGTIPDVSGLPSLSLVALDANNLTGTLPDFASNPAVTLVAVQNNYLTGTIPRSLLALPRLEYFVAFNNSLTGSIPPIPSPNGKFRVIDVSFNMLEGTVPDPLPHGLEGLALTACNLSGTIPSLPASLNTLSFAENGLTGTIPPLNHTVLTFFDVRDNKLTGTLPHLGGLAATLQSFIIANNRLHGTLPASLPLPHLQVFWARANRLTGTVSDLSRASSLISLDLSSNRLSGSYPASKSLQFASFRDNAFTHAKLDLYHRLPQLAALDLSRNDLGGQPWVDTIADLTGITFLSHGTSRFGKATVYVGLSLLKMDGCNVTGSFNDAPLFEYAPLLMYLSVESNTLVGPLPSFIIPNNMFFLSLASNADISGTLPPSFAPAVDGPLSFLNLQATGVSTAAASGPRPRSAADALPPFLTTAATTQYFAPTPHVSPTPYRCPDLTATHETAAHIVVSPAYYDYALCTCARGYVGLVAASPECRSANDICLGSPDDSDACIDIVSATNVSIARGHWPTIVDPTSASLLYVLPCENAEYGASHCNTDGAVECHISRATGTINCEAAGPLCAPGYRDRLCSRCDQGWYATGSGQCERCNSAFTVVFISLAVLVLAVMTLLVCCGDPHVRGAQAGDHGHATRARAEESEPLLTSITSIHSINSAESGFDSRCASLPMVIRAMWPFMVLSLAELLLGIVLLFLSETSTADVGLALVAIILTTAFLASSKYRELTSAAETVGDDDGDYDGENCASDTSTTTEARLAALAGLFKSFIVFVQSTDLVLGSTFEWPGVLVSLRRHLATLTVRAEGLECFSAAFEYNGKYLVIVSLPVVFALLLALLAGARLALAAAARARAVAWRGASFAALASHTWDRVVSASVFVFYVLFMDVAVVSLERFTCVPSPVPGSSTSYVESDPWVECTSGAWTAVTIGWLVMYGAAMVWLAVHLARHSAAIVAPSSVPHALAEHIESRFGFVYECFRPGAWYFDVAILGRRLILAALVSLVHDTSPALPLAVVGVLIAAAWIHGAAAPFTTPLNNMLETAAIGLTLFSYVGSLVLATQAETGAGAAADTVAVAWILVVLNAALCATFVCAMALVVVADLSSTVAARLPAPVLIALVGDDAYHARNE